MGDDTPLAAFSTKQRNFSDFFKQKFAQVTNPPIDPIREKIVMSLNTGFGSKGNILDESESKARRLKTVSPILSHEKLEVLKSYGDPKSPRYDAIFKHKVFSVTYKGDLKKALEQLCETVLYSIKHDDTKIIMLDDSNVDANHKSIPMLMAVGRIHRYLIENGQRSRASIVAITGQMQDSHMAASLLAFGATAIYPYMLFATVYEKCVNEGMDELKIRKHLKNVFTAINAGILKILSKMGIATAASYKNSALFDAIGLSKEVVSECFEGAYPLLPGLGYEDIDKRIEHFHKNAFEDKERIFPLEIGGFYKYIENGEYHDFGPQVVHAIHKAVESGSFDDYQAFKALVESRDKKMVRDFLALKSNKKPISLDKVEPKEAIFKRFATAAMSLGSISPEAHECLAEAMNTIGGMSNCGEGGEDEARFNTIKNSKIKQVASGRFGVTPAYLVSAEEIQIKIAQGAKPGEGGQLPGYKVNALVARLRHTNEGITLISPPPHHDIYSIEDLAQLIFDLKQVNPNATVTVKLVSTAGVGTIAAGVAKAYADKIIISGGDGGTGAAPHTSIKFAGNPWELGLSEAHNALKVNNLRANVHLQTDGGLKTGLDVVKAAILGAESYAFGTGALTLIGCKILRICHLNRCTVGVATQEQSLREHYVGSVEKVVNYFTMLAEDVRQILATLGYKRLEDIIGKTELLEVIDDEMAKKFDFSSLLMKIDGVNTCQVSSNDPYDKNEYEKQILKDVYNTIANPSDSIVIDREICNLNRSFGARISGEIAKFYGDKGLPEDSIKIRLKGIAGQSLGAFLANGVSIYVDGAGNDYVGKGMNGGKIVITNQNGGSSFSLAGNTCLYGATGGKLYVAGNVGERFAVRNSGCLTIVEGTGDHPCEYMTGGIAVILGKTGVNFGAGMTGGVAFVYDEEHQFIETINQELIEAVRIDTDDKDFERHYLKKLLKDYINETGSDKAKMIIDNFRVNVRNFWMVKPKDVKSPLDVKQGE
jgi:glutamate synthase (NADPH/NADH) large chain